MSNITKIAIASILVAATSQVAMAQRNFDNVEIKSTEIADNIYMLEGAGGNIGMSVGDDGVFLIDDQFAPLSKKILEAIGEITDKPVSYVVNTHWHGDHTGGNENMGAAGAVIVAHDNVRKRMSTKQLMKAFGREVPASPDAALPVVTFSENATYYFNDNQIQIMHVPTAHTDGDSFVFFTEANVIHMGDTFFNGFFPFIDQSSGGTLDGVIAAAEKALSIVDDNTVILPGHGPLSGKADLETYLGMLNEVKGIMMPIVESGKSRDDVLSANPLGELGQKWGNGFMKTEIFTGIVYDVLSSR